MKTRVEAVLFTVVMLLGLSGGMDNAAESAEYPNKPITQIVPYTAGGATDIGARAMATVMSKYLGQPIITVNKPGAQGAVGSAFAVKAKADGYTLLHYNRGIVTAGLFEAEVPFTPDDFQLIFQYSFSRQLIAANYDAPFHTFKEMIGYAQKHPDFRYSHFGRGSVPHLAMSVVGKKEGIPFIDIPCKGDPESLAQILGGHVQAVGTSMPPILKLLEAKKLRVLLALTEQRLDEFPEIPTFRELYPEYLNMYGSWLVLCGPKGMPGEVITKVNEAFKKAKEDASLNEVFKNVGMPLYYADSQEVSQKMSHDKEMFKKVFEEVGLTKKK